MMSSQGFAAAAQPQPVPVPVAFWGSPMTYNVMAPMGPQQVQQTQHAHQQMQRQAPMPPMPHLLHPPQQPAPAPAPLQVVWMPFVARPEKDAPMVPMMSKASTAASEAPDYSDAPTRRPSASSWASTPTCFSAAEETTIGGEHGSEPQQLAGRVRTMSGDAAGSRALQAALDEARSDEERAAIADEFRGRVWEAIRCPNANHVVQKIIEVLPAEAAQFILDEIAAGPDGRGRGVAHAARHRFGCRVLERLVEQARPESCTALLDELVADSAELFVHPFGNYVIQHLLEHAPYEWRAKLLCMLEENIDLAATKPYARAVVSQALAYAEDNDLASLARALCSRPGLLASMARTRHGHGGVARLVRSLGGAEGQEVRRQLMEESGVFKSTRYGRAVALALKGM